MLKTETCKFCGITTNKIDYPTHKYLISSPGCWKLYNDLLVKEYSNFQYFKFHDLTVDTYALQHPGTESAQTIQSANIHLASLYSYFQNNVELDKLSNMKQKVARQKSLFKWLTPPKKMKEKNLLQVLNSNSIKEYETYLNDWAFYVFNTWVEHHKAIEEYL